MLCIHFQQPPYNFYSHAQSLPHQTKAVMRYHLGL